MSKKKITLGQIAHEAGAKAGDWRRKWSDLHPSQCETWEKIAQTLSEIEREECAKLADKKLHIYLARQIRARGFNK